MSARHLNIFARYPQPGATKTRLIPALGAEGAAALQHRMTLGTLVQARRLRDEYGTLVTLHFTGAPDEKTIRSCYGADLTYRPQGDGDLGLRLLQSFAH